MRNTPTTRHRLTQDDPAAPRRRHQGAASRVPTALTSSSRSGHKPQLLRASVTSIEAGWPALIRNSRNIGDFKKWKTHDSYQKAFERLLRDLNAEGSTGVKAD